MFGKKKDKDVAAESAVEPKGKAKEAVAPKPTAASKAAAAPKAPKAKGSKRKNSLAKGGPGFFAAHIEKIITVGTLGAVGFLVYSGFSAPGFDSTAAPDKLEKDSKDLLTQISQDHWAEIAAAPERQIKHDFAALAAEARKPTDPSLYNNGVWDPKPQGVFEKRGDPTLYPPEQLVVRSVSGAMAVEVPLDSVEPYEDLDDAEPIRPKQKKSRNSRAAGGMSGEGGAGAGYAGGEAGAAGYGMGGYGMGMDGGAGGPNAQKPKRFLKADYNRGVMVGMAGGAAGGMGGYGMGGGEGGMGMGMDAGMMGGAPGMMGPGGGVGTNTPAFRDGLSRKNKEKLPKIKVGSKAVVFNAITALVPHKKMVDDYLLQFQDSGIFNPMRDMPTYLSFELQRVDVTADPNRVIAEKDWQKVSDGVVQLNLPKNDKWAARRFIRGFERPLAPPVQEVIDRQAVAPRLTMPIPPMLIQDYRSFAKHPAIDWIWDVKMMMPRRPKPVVDPDDDTKSLPSPRQGGGGMGGGMGGYGAMGGAGYGSEGGMGMGMGGGYGGDAGMGGYGMGGGGYGADAGMGGYGMGGGYGGEAGMGMGGYGMGGGYGGEGGMGGMGGYGGGMYGGMGMSTGASQPEFKMVRCYDFLAQKDIGRVFRYRIRLEMSDPNYPEDARIQRPPPHTLKDEVYARVAPLMIAEDQKIKADPKAKRTSRLTGWSEPSPPARVEVPSDILAGDVEFDGPKSFKIDEKTSVSMTVKEPKGVIVATTMDWTTGAMFATERDVRRGTVLAEKDDVELVVPSSRLVKIKKDQPIDARATVVDMRGGKPLAGDSRDDPLKDIGEMLILKRDGSVEIANEFDDMFLYRMYKFQDEHDMVERMSNPAGGAMGGAYGGEGGYGGGMPGSGMPGGS